MKLPFLKSSELNDAEARTLTRLFSNCNAFPNFPLTTVGLPSIVPLLPNLDISLTITLLISSKERRSTGSLAE
ncbi:hypothetical protein FJZ33_08690 [Candidatus Poribacteria bacterium]|nr:hypothetical protein [Candidatus Poribacteria bacterium]